MRSDDPDAQSHPDPRGPDQADAPESHAGSALPDTQRSRRALLRAAVAGSVAITGAGAAAAAAVAPWRPQIFGPIKTAFAAASPTPTATPHSTPTPLPPPAVTIQGYKFHPAALTVPRGTTVTWTNQDSVSHTSTSDTSGLWDSGQIAGTGGTFIFTFNLAPGTYNYHCSNHPFMPHGSITVT